MTLAPNGLYYGALSVGTSSTPQSVTLTNQQNVPLNIASVGATANYTETDNCVSSSPIAPGGTCTINVTFTPAVSGMLTGQVTVADDAPGGFQVVNMTGTGSAPAVTLAPTSLKFTALTGSTSAAKTVKLTNSGVGSLVISSITTSGDYGESDNCVSASPLAAGAFCTISATFSPTRYRHGAGHDHDLRQWSEWCAASHSAVGIGAGHDFGFSGDGDFPDNHGGQYEFARAGHGDQ